MARGDALLCAPAGYGVALFRGGKILCSFGKGRRIGGPVGGKEEVFCRLVYWMAGLHGGSGVAKPWR